ncbi:fibrinogen-like protein A [Dysidea avara]|uniref:fibrinogen-like protein A n=1 Tax=Dysidea avara TaxID=196820 RepID=UPI0033275073
MTTIITVTLVVLVSLGIVLVDGECQTNGGPIDNCCCLGYNNNNYNVKSSGVYTIGNFCGVKCSNARVYCDTTSGGGGWTVIQRRRDGSIDFKKRDWVEYEDGFGSLSGEFWLGLRSINCLTSQGNWELRIDYQLSNRTKSYLHYKQFSVGPSEDQYQLSISGFDSVGLTDPFYYNADNTINGMKFSSHDRENDLWSPGNCAHNDGGWWYKSCGTVWFNNNYNGRSVFLNGQYLVLPFLEIKIRPLNCNNHAVTI